MTAFRPGQSPPPVRTPTRMRLPSQVSPARLVPMSVLAIDAGTTGVTALVVTADGTVAGRGYQEFRQYFPKPGWVEYLPEGIWQATLGACAQALDEAGSGGSRRSAGSGGSGRSGGSGGTSAESAVSCVGITNQRETAVIWDRTTLA